MVTIIKRDTPTEKSKKLIDEVVARTGKKNLKKYAGILRTSLDPLEYQKKVRSEWE